MSLLLSDIPAGRALEVLYTSLLILPMESPAINALFKGASKAR